MRRILNGLLALLCCLTLCAPALAEIVFVPDMAGWMLDAIPLELTLSAEVTAYAPFDENRLPQVTDLFKHLSMRLTRQPMDGETQSTLQLLVDDEEALSIGLQQSGQRTLLQLSTLPGITFAGTNPLSALLGVSDEPMTLLGFDGTEAAWVKEGYELLAGLETALAPHLTSESKTKTDLKDIGTARLKQDYTVSKTDAPSLTALIVSVCPEGRLKELASRLVFSGKQTLRVYRDEDHNPLRVEWNGNCGLDEDHLRTVALVWRMRRDDKAYRDEITLKTPPLRGSDRNTLNWSFAIAPNKSGQMVLTYDLSYTRNIDKQKTVWSGSGKLTAETISGSTSITGEASLYRQLPDEDSATGYTFAPSLIVSGDSNMPSVTGSLTVSSVNGKKKVLSQAKLQVELLRTDYSAWLMRESTFELDGLAEASLEALRQQVQAANASALLRRLVLLPREDLDYLFKDIPEESVQAIINAALAQ